MSNNRVFVLCQTNIKRWQMRCANAERHVESRDFAAYVEKDFGTMLSAVTHSALTTMYAGPHR